MAWAVQDGTCLQALQLRDLQKVTLLGAGAYGQVLLVKHGGKHYALKCMSKLQIVENGLQVGTAPAASLWDHATIELRALLRPAGRVYGQSQCFESASWCSPEPQRAQLTFAGRTASAMQAWLSKQPCNASPGHEVTAVPLSQQAEAD